MSNPDWWLDPPDEPNFFCCDVCHKERYAEDEMNYYPRYKKWICDYCIDEYEKEQLEENEDGDNF
ncbi:MAG: hypothetical protein PHU53_07280 [Thermoplasmata archaeon]|nr:hypothetical protein [Thermoplasmata archaeon]